MKHFAFRKGLVFIRDEQKFTLLRRLMDSSFQLESEDGELIKCSEAEIILGCSRGEWIIDDAELDAPLVIDPKISRDLSTFSEEVQRKAYRKDEYLRRVTGGQKFVMNYEKLEKQIAQIAVELNDPNPPSALSLYRWNRKKQKGRGSTVDLVDRFEQRGRRLSWSKTVKDIVDKAIEEVYFNHQLYPKGAVAELVETRIGQWVKKLPPDHEIKLPSKSSIYRYIEKLEAYNVISRRLGKSEADLRFRSVKGKQIATRLLERWEIDHTPLDILVVCEKSFKPLGRPWLTITIDKYSRMIVGFYLSFREPSAYAVLQCLKQAILPKDEILAAYPDIKTPWPARGIPETIVCDNGMDLHANALMSFCQELGIQVQFCPAKTPQYKGSVERVFRTIEEGLIHQLPGTVFANINARGDYPSEAKASLTFSDLQHLLIKWIVDIYHLTHHRGLV
ncbi:integrase catalytic domain-containing protein [Methylophilus sp. 'Pure River']|uniref:integrase catalytic domain-containing protein n=1 Tax=Methylophilus sp. 'Pure River' TaxID=3377117 RepID=UPI00398E6F80